MTKKIKYADIKKYFVNDLWDDKKVKRAYDLNVITKSQYEKILNSKKVK